MSLSQSLFFHSSPISLRRPHFRTLLSKSSSSLQSLLHLLPDDGRFCALREAANCWRCSESLCLLHLRPFVFSIRASFLPTSSRSISVVRVRPLRRADCNCSNSACCHAVIGCGWTNARWQMSHRRLQNQRAKSTLSHFGLL